LPTDASVIGYEVVGLEVGFSFHSWHCHGFADQVRRELGIAIGPTGLLTGVSDAVQVLDYLRSRPSWDAPYDIPWTVAALARLTGVPR
jgi:hypothetical protein